MFRESEKGQALTEYILLLAVVVGVFLSVSRWITKTGAAGKLSGFVTGPFAAAYRYGHTKAKGLDDGGPEYHPRLVGGDTNFRIFFNPDSAR